MIINISNFYIIQYATTSLAAGVVDSVLYSVQLTLSTDRFTLSNAANALRSNGRKSFTGHSQSGTIAYLLALFEGNRRLTMFSKLTN